MRIRVRGKGLDVEKKDSGAGRQGRPAAPCGNYKGFLRTYALCENCGWRCDVHPLTNEQFVRMSQ